jgi:hypothetical protein
MTKPRNAVPGRDNALEGLVAAVTSRPFDMDNLIKARDEVRQEHGEGALIEAAMVLGYSDCLTKITDATGKRPLPSILWTFLKVVFSIFRCVYENCLARRATR